MVLPRIIVLSKSHQVFMPMWLKQTAFFLFPWWLFPLPHGLLFCIFPLFMSPSFIHTHWHKSMSWYALGQAQRIHNQTLPRWKVLLIKVQLPLRGNSSISTDGGSATAEASGRLIRLPVCSHQYTVAPGSLGSSEAYSTTLTDSV